MVGVWGAYNNIFLLVIGVVTLLFFGLPLMLAPMSWARAFRWKLPKEKNLAITLGRSLGILISIISIFAINAVRTPAAKPFFFDLLLLTFISMAILHIYGAFRKVQPFTETIEIGMWVALGILALCFYPV